MDLPYLSRTAKKLKIDYAPAFFGFENNGRRPLPIIKGIVICEEFENELILK